MKETRILCICSAVLVALFSTFGCDNAATPESGGLDFSSAFRFQSVADSVEFKSGNGVCGEHDTLVFASSPCDMELAHAVIGGGSDSVGCSCDSVAMEGWPSLPVTTRCDTDSMGHFEIYFGLPEYFKDVTLGVYVNADDGARISINGEFVEQIDLFDQLSPDVNDPMGHYIVIGGDSLFAVGANTLSFDVVNTGVGLYGDPVARADSSDCMYVEFHGTVRYVVEPPCEVEIDVKPGSDSNPINCKKMNGVIPVAILSTDCFDATAVDHTTVRFGPNGAMEAHWSKHGMKRHEEDIDYDGDIDLVFHFRGYETGIVCGDTIVTLTGSTFAGEEFEASDVIRTVPGGDCGGDDD
jgi:hypothetical protein